MENIVDIVTASALVAQLNARLHDYRMSYCAREATASQRPWAAGMTVQEIADVLYDVNKLRYTYVIKDKRKFINIDTAEMPYASGRFMVEKETGKVYGIKGYGVVDRSHFYGYVNDPKTLDEMFKRCAY